MSNKVNFKNLKRKEIRKELRDGVLIYNPSAEAKKKLLQIITKNADGSEINISGIDLFLKVIPILTNIEIPNDMSEEVIQETLDDPDDLLLEVIDEVKIVLESFVEKTEKTIKDMNAMPKEKLQEFIKQYAVSEETPVEKRKRELREELEALDKLEE